jgi:hypothetical protein
MLELLGAGRFCLYLGPENGDSGGAEFQASMRGVQFELTDQLDRQIHSGFHGQIFAFTDWLTLASCALREARPIATNSANSTLALVASSA